MLLNKLSKSYSNRQEVLVVELQATDCHVLSSFLPLPLASRWESPLCKKTPATEVQNLSVQSELYGTTWIYFFQCSEGEIISTLGALVSNLNLVWSA